MAKPQQNLVFDIDLDELNAIKDMVGATEAQVLAAYNRALSRTTQTLRKLSNSLVKDELAPKTMKKLRSRLKYFRVKSPSKLNKLDEVKLWFGLDDVPISYLKGKQKRLGSKSKPRGAVFTPKGRIETETFEQGFIANSHGRKSIFTRTTKKRYPIKEVQVSISDRFQITVEDEIFDKLPEVFLKHFETDLKGRVKMGLNQKNWRQ